MGCDTQDACMAPGYLLPTTTQRAQWQLLLSNTFTITDYKLHAVGDTASCLVGRN